MHKLFNVADRSAERCAISASSQTNVDNLASKAENLGTIGSLRDAPRIMEETVEAPVLFGRPYYILRSNTLRWS